MMKIETAYILAGGESRRMGQDKLFLSLNGTTLLEHTISVCREIFPQTKLVVRSSEKFRGFDIPVILDFPGVAGPLAGILAALGDCRSQACFVTAADLPDLDGEIIADLIENYDGIDFLGLSEQQKVQPLCGIYSSALLKELLEAAKKTDYRICEIIMTLDYRLLPHKKRIWRNINTPQDLMRR